MSERRERSSAVRTPPAEVNLGPDMAPVDSSGAHSPVDDVNDRLVKTVQDLKKRLEEVPKLRTSLVDANKKVKRYLDKYEDAQSELDEVRAKLRDAERQLEAASENEDNEPQAKRSRLGQPDACAQCSSLEIELERQKSMTADSSFVSPRSDTSYNGTPNTPAQPSDDPVLNDIAKYRKLPNMRRFFEGDHDKREAAVTAAAVHRYYDAIAFGDSPVNVAIFRTLLRAAVFWFKAVIYEKEEGERAKDKNEGKNAEIKKRDVEITKLRDDLQLQTEKNNSLAASIGKFEEQAQKLSEFINGCEERLKKKENEITQLTQQKSDLELNVTNLTKEKTLLEEDRDGVTRELNDLESDFTISEDKLKNELKDKCQHSVQLQKTIDELRQRLSEVEAQYKDSCAVVDRCDRGTSTADLCSDVPSVGSDCAGSAVKGEDQSDQQLSRVSGAASSNAGCSSGGGRHAPIQVSPKLSSSLRRLARDVQEKVDKLPANAAEWAAPELEALVFMVRRMIEYVTRLIQPDPWTEQVNAAAQELGRSLEVLRRKTPAPAAIEQIAAVVRMARFGMKQSAKENTEV